MGWTLIGPDDRSLMWNAPAVGQNRDGRLEVFALNHQMRLVHTWELAANSGRFASWRVFPHRDEDKFDGPIAMARNPDGRLEVFAHGAYNHRIWHIWQTAPSNGWSNITDMGGSQLYDVKAVHNADGHLEVMATHSFDIQHRWQGGAGWWPPGWQGMDARRHLYAGYVLGRNGDGRLEIFIPRGDWTLWHRWQHTPNGVFGNWEKMHDKADPLAAPTNKAGGLTLFARSNGVIIFTHWGPGPWAPWQRLGGPMPRIDRITGATEADGTLAIFCEGLVPIQGTQDAYSSGTMRARQRDTNGRFENWEPVGGALITPFKRDDGRLEVFANMGGRIGRLT